MSSPRSSLTRRLALAVLVLALLAVGANQLLFGVYRVDSPSMEPVLHGDPEDGDVVLVRYARGRVPQRFELVVARDASGGTPKVKRVVGLPGEAVRIDRGDLLIDGRRLPLEAPRPPLVPVFDDRDERVEDFFEMGSSTVHPWRREGEEFVLDGSDVPLGSQAGLMFFSKRVRDGYREPDGSPVAGSVHVNDLVLECEVLLGDPPAHLRFVLLELGDTYRALIDPLATAGGPSRGPGPFRLALAHRYATAQATPDPDAGRERVLAETELELDPADWHRVRFLDVDDHLALELDGALVLTADPGPNHYHPSDRPPLGRSFGPRAALGGEAGRARFRSIRLWRDLFYTDRGTYAVERPLVLGPDEVFLLGDRSSVSRDGRDFGPTRLADLVGRPTCVIWPLSRARCLEPPRPLVAERRP